MDKNLTKKIFIGFFSGVLIGIIINNLKIIDPDIKKILIDFFTFGGEIFLKNRKMTREEAIAKLREAKELLDLEMMSQEDYDALRKELSPIIMNKN